MTFSELVARIADLHPADRAQLGADLLSRLAVEADELGLDGSRARAGARGLYAAAAELDS